MKRQQAFIYAPTTGDKVFAQKEHRSIVVVKYRNQSRHVWGGSPVLSWEAAQAGKYWRSAAARIAASLIESYGGIAWDERGTIRMIVPANMAVQAMEIMDKSAYLHGDTHIPNDNLLLLVAAGIASINWVHPRATLENKCFRDQILQWRSARRERTRLKGTEGKWSIEGTTHNPGEGEELQADAPIIEVGQKQDDFVAEYVSSPQWWWDLDVSGGEQIPDAPLLEKEVEE